MSFGGRAYRLGEKYHAKSLTVAEHICMRDSLLVVHRRRPFIACIRESCYSDPYFKTLANPLLYRRCANAMSFNGFDLAEAYPYELKANETGIVQNIQYYGELLLFRLEYLR